MFIWPKPFEIIRNSEEVNKGGAVVKTHMLTEIVRDVDTVDEGRVVLHVLGVPKCQIGLLHERSRHSIKALQRPWRMTRNTIQSS